MTTRIGYWQFLAKKIANDLDPVTAKRGEEMKTGFTEIIDALESMIECTGGSENWNGCTETALKKIEAILK